MIRIATADDADQLDLLNNEFNGQGNTSIDCIRDSVLNNKQEVVIVAQENEVLAGFVCVQLKKHFAMMSICLKSRKSMSDRNIEKRELQVR